MKKSRYYLYLTVSILALGVSGVLYQGLSNSPKKIKIPLPQEAAQQAEKLNPEEITQIEVDEQIRDRLRTDPEWREIAAAIRQDIMILKWGVGKPQNPAWKRYGAKAYPLLDYYTRSKDEVRQEYGVVGIRSLGKPYTTLWLTRHLQQKLTTPDIYSLTVSLKTLRDGVNDGINNEKAWLKEFGLDEKATRDRLVNLAKQNLKPEPSTSEYPYKNHYQLELSEFNKDFLVAVLGDNQVYPPISQPEASQPPLNLPEWSKFERLTQPNPSQIKSAIAYYRSLPTKTQERLLVERFGKVKAGKISQVGKAILQDEANSPKSTDQTWAIAELERHRDSQGTKLLQNIINNDLSKIYPITRVTGYESHSTRNTHAYYLLINIAHKYPQSKFVTGCREYGDLTGFSYFDKAERPPTIRDRNAKKTPSQQSQDWQRWLSKYPSHPGADDATYHLARSLQENNDVMGAMRLWNKLMTQPVGDGDAVYLAYPHLRSLLDVGLTTEQIETLLKEPAIEPMVPLLKYALSVRYARGQNYAKALETSAKLDLTKMPNNVLGSYYNYNPYWWTGRLSNPSAIEVQKQIQAMLSEQRQRWQHLLKLQQENTPDSQYQLASNWAGAGGWKNGYMAIWDGFRAFHLPLEDCETWWVCNMKRREPNLVRSLYQDSSQNAVALSQYQKLLDNPHIPLQLREKTLYMVASTLLWQWENHPSGETLRIHPPAGVSGKPYLDNDDYQNPYKQMLRDYQSRVDQIISELQIRFPQSAYIDDLLFSNRHLQKLCKGERPFAPTKGSG
jgi:hypothetical protein